MYSTLKKACELISTQHKHVLEFGVYKGGTIRYLHKLLSSKFSIFGFDSFIGLPEDWSGTPCKKGEFSVDGIIPDIDNIKFYKGWFQDTLPLYKQIAEPIALLHIDCDLYSSTKIILETLDEFIIKDTVIVFDEWYYNFNDIEENRQHEQKAFYEWVNDRKFIIYPEYEPEKRIIKIL